MRSSMADGRKSPLQQLELARIYVYSDNFIPPGPAKHTAETHPT